MSARFPSNGSLVRMFVPPTYPPSTTQYDATVLLLGSMICLALPPQKTAFVTVTDPDLLNIPFAFSAVAPSLSLNVQCRKIEEAFISLNTPPPCPRRSLSG